MSSESIIGCRRLDALVERLRGPEGCPWDQEQRLEDMRAYLLEEAHEVAAAIDGADWSEVEAELGDLLFLIVFCARLGAEAGESSLGSIIDRVEAKMIDRHPHVFGGEQLADSGAVRRSWERRKLEEEPRAGSMLDGVSTSLPALVSAYRMTQKAAGVGFDWTDMGGVLDKLEEELAELRVEIESGETAPQGIRDELGDVLFSIVNLSRHLGIDPEGALQAANRKFRGRFGWIEGALAERGSSPAEVDLETLERLWAEAKATGL